MALLVIVYLIALTAGKKIIEKSLQKFAHNKNVSPGRIKTLDKLLVNVFSYIALFFLVLMLFSTIGVGIGPLIMGAGGLGWAVVLGAQGLVSDVVAGFFIFIAQQLDAVDDV